MDLRTAVLAGVRERIGLLNAYLGDDESPERWALEALEDRLMELEAGAGRVRGHSTWIAGAPDYTDQEIDKELLGIFHDLRAADFALDVIEGIEGLPVAAS